MIKAFYSDPHYGHANIIKYCDRPFEDVEHMQREMIARYNAMIGLDDVVVWCGDCAMGHKKLDRLRDVLATLNGTKWLVRGNHDHEPAAMLSAGFAVVADVLFLRIAGMSCRVYHYPPAWADAMHVKDGHDKYESVRPPEVPGEIIIHGHTHVTHTAEKNLIHVGVDAWGYAPAPYERVAELIEKTPNRERWARTGCDDVDPRKQNEHGL